MQESCKLIIVLFSKYPYKRIYRMNLRVNNHDAKLNNIEVIDSANDYKIIFSEAKNIIIKNDCWYYGWYRLIIIFI